jgi:multidrug efflux pump
VHEVVVTLRDAVILVAIVVLLFLQDWKSLLLPVIDVAVSLVGTFAVMALMGFSLNNLTLFGLVLAIGIVVDDAIVVLENIERWLEKGLSVREATIKAMNEITGPILAITLVLSSVLLPSAFLGGIILEPFEKRRDPSLSGEAIAAQLRARMQKEVPDARVLVFMPPAVRGLGNAGGFKLMVEATGDVDFDALQAQADKLAAEGNQQTGLVGLFNGFRARTPQLYVDIDRTKVKTMGVELSDVFQTLQAYLGSFYVNDFNRFGRTWQVNVQADAPFRTDAQAVQQLKVRNADGDMVPLGAVAEVQDSAGPVQITRYNMFPAAAINGASLPGMSTGDVLATMEKLAEELPRSMTYEWTELSYLQKQASKVEQFRDLQQIPFTAFVLGVVLVFFVLAGLYESWSLPLSVILVVPMTLLSGLTGVALAGMDVNIFVQVGFVVLVGLAAKNAILIVEFARDRQQEGASVFDAAVEAAKVRLRPIIMTSFAFILGVFPLVIAHGAGAEMRRTLGTAVFSGMLGVTLFGIFLTPVFYSVVRRLSGPKSRDQRSEDRRMTAS